ncbi:hypothetical protein C8Q76DRAFT_708380, partial [Earliella scabrosa]
MDSPADLVIHVQSIYILVYCFLAIIAIVIYEWLASLEDEIDLIWCGCGRGGLSIVSTLYILSRYAWILDLAVTLTTINPVSYTSCQVLGRVLLVLLMIEECSAAVFAAIRVYAISGRNFSLAVITLLLAMVLPLAQLVYQAPERLEVLPPPFNCTNLPFFQSPQIVITLIMLSHGAMAIADFIAVAVTWRKTYATYRSLPQANMRVSLARVLLYDGK